MADPEQVEKAPRQIGVRALRGNLDAVLREAKAGTSFQVTLRGAVLAEIHPPSPTARAVREPGALRGRIHIGPDFDTLPPDVLAAMAGEDR
jgi:antitoxin (DNA-binding transcriptional repressor) of toxin-antitoxin stability system